MPSPRYFATFFLLASTAAAAQTPTPATPEKELDRIVVKGRVQTHYKAEDTSIATRTDTPLEQVPQSVQVIDRQLIEDQAAGDVTDLYRNISGVSFFSYSGVTMRGFRQDNVLYDGLRGDPYAGFSVPRLFNISELQVLKGATGAMYGDGDPGGVINYTSKKPTGFPQRIAKLKLGNDDFAAASLEASGPLGNGGLRYRVGGYADSERPWRYSTRRRSRIGEAAFASELGDHGDLLVQFTDIQQRLKGNRLRGVMVDESGRFLTTRRWNAAEPGDFLDHRAQAVFARYTFDPGESFAFNTAMRWFRNTERQQYHEPRGLARDGRTMNREFRDQDRRNQGFSFNANGIFRFATGGVDHRVLLGFESYQRSSNLDSRTAYGKERKGPVPGLDLFEPVYGLTGAGDYGLRRIPFRLSRNWARDQAVYLQDQAALSPRWHVLAGLRRDRYAREDLRSGQRASGGDLTWRLGLTHVLREGFNLYFNTSTGFKPQSIAAHSPLVGGPFDPQRSRQWEIGLKAHPNDGRTRLNLAAYRIERTNILQSTGQDPGNDGQDDFTALGLVRSQGFEADLLTDLTARWVLNLSYSYNDASVMRGSPASAGNTSGGNSRRFANAPRHKLGMWTRYDIPSLKSAIGFGADYVGERVSLNGQPVRPYTLFDISWQTRHGAWEWQANIKNLFDKVYSASGFTRHNGHFPGEPRRLYIEARYRF